MPLYEYECIENGHRFELIRKFSDPEVRRCIKCKSKVKRLLSAPAISFKGSGWYVTDYARGSSGNGSGKDPKDARDSSDLKEKKDSKPSEKSTSKSKSEGGGADSKKR